MTTFCKCDKQFGELSVYAWIDGKSVLICEQCQKIDKPMTDHYNSMRARYSKKDNEPPENKKDEKLSSDHFWMLFINPVAKMLDDTNDFKADILEKNK